MRCHDAREAISAALDGEQLKVGRERLEVHVRACPACRRWEVAAAEVTRRTRLQSAGHAHTGVEDLQRRVLEEFASRRRPNLRRPGLLSAARLGLVLVALLQIALTVPVVLRGAGDTGWDLASLEVALAVGFLVCAIRPTRARALVMMVGTGAILVVLTAGIEISLGRIGLSDAIPHVVTLVGWLLICLVALCKPRLSDDHELGIGVWFWRISRAALHLQTPDRGEARGLSDDPMRDRAGRDLSTGDVAGGRGRYEDMGQRAV